MSKLRVKEIAHSNGTQAMTITTGGVITQGNPVACRCWWTHSGGSNNTSNCDIYFIENTGGFTRQSGNSQLVIPVTGWYIVMAGMIPSGATNDFDYRVLKNTTSTSPFLFDMRQSDASSGTHQNSAGSVATNITAGQYITIMSLDDGDAAHTGSADAPHCWLSVVKVG